MQIKCAGMEKHLQCKWKCGKKSGVAILTPYQKYFKTKIVESEKGHYLMINGWTQQENITTVNIYALNIGAMKFISQILPNIERNWQ